MTAQVIEVHNLGKEYRIGAEKQFRNTTSLQEAITGNLKNIFRRTSRETHPETYFWALRNIDLSITRGEVVGVIGRNGSGKSTFLKILSDIVEPTEGRAEIRGRVASLLEVGTGFHGELTGRENIFLNGALIGMKQHEVRRNFDRIVEFAEIGKFLDTPVKRYSSGMYVRLAFAVAAHLDPEVLIVDEVLAVGDFSFQQKCLGRMRDVAKDGRTVLFVSHNVASVEALCSRCVLLDGGRLIHDGEPYEVTREYRRQMSEVSGSALVSLDHIQGAARKVPVLSRACTVDEKGDLTTVIAVSRAFEIRVGVRLPRGLRDLVFVVRIDSMYGTRMLTMKSPLKESLYTDLCGDHEVRCRVHEFPLTPGPYLIGLAVFAGDDMIDSIDNILSLTVTDGEVFSEGRGAVAGMFITRSHWSIGPYSDAAAKLIGPNLALEDAALNEDGGAIELENQSSLSER